MKAVLTIGHRAYVVPCAKKALAFAEFMQTAKEVDIGQPYTRGVIFVSTAPEVTVETIPSTTEIRKGKTLSTLEGKA